MFNIRLLIPALLIPFLGYTQNVPGYMGKRWNFQYQGYMFTSLINPSGSEINYDDSGYQTQAELGINYQHHLTAGYSVSKRADFIVDLSKTTTYMNPFKGEDFSSFKKAGLTYPEINATGFAAGIRLYTKHFAPLGSYISFKLGYTGLKVEDLYYTYTDPYAYPTDEDYQQDLYIKGDNSGALTLAIGFGTNRVIADRIIMSYGLDLGLYTAMAKSFIPFFDSFEGSGDNIYFAEGNTKYNRDAYLYQANMRYTLYSIFNFKLGVGVLL